MQRLRRHTWSVSLLSALLVVGLLQAYPALPGSLPSRNTPAPDATPPFPHQDDPTGPRIGIPLSAAVPAAQSEDPLAGAPDGTTASKGHLPAAWAAAFAGTPGVLAAPPSGHAGPSARLHLFCVYRL